MATMLHPTNPFHGQTSLYSSHGPIIQYNGFYPDPQLAHNYTPDTCQPAISRKKTRHAPPAQTSPSPPPRMRGIAVPIVSEHELHPITTRDDEIINVPVRVTTSFRQASLKGSSDLPSRPQPRSFLRRVSTRLSPSVEQSKYTAVKMPRREYKKYFARDRHGKHAGSEAEREWTMEDLAVWFGRYQSLKLGSIASSAVELGWEGDWWTVDAGDCSR